jgi:hypothetical protein
VCFVGDSCGHSRHPALPPIELSTPSQKSDVSMFHLATMADSGAVCVEATTSHHYRFSVKFWLRPQSFVLMSHTFPWSSCYCLLSLFHSNRSARFASLLTGITHTSSFFRLFNSPLGSVSRWCNTNRKLSAVLSPQQHKNHQNNRFWKQVLFDSSYTAPSCYSVQHCRRQQMHFPVV